MNKENFMTQINFYCKLNYNLGITQHWEFMINPKVSLLVNKENDTIFIVTSDGVHVPILYKQITKICLYQSDKYSSQGSLTFYKVTPKGEHKIIAVVNKRVYD